MADIVKATDDRDPWDQQEGEAHIWFERFSIFRLLGPTRTVPKAYRKWRYDTTQTLPDNKNTAGWWYDEAEKSKWTARAEAWDESQREYVEDRALEVYNDGLSFAHERVAKLKLIAEKLEKHILDAKTTRISPFVIEQYRGILDDIAKERGDRTKETRITGAQGGPIIIETQWGRGGTISDAWNQLPAPQQTVIEAVVKEEAIDEQ